MKKKLQQSTVKTLFASFNVEEKITVKFLVVVFEIDSSEKIM